MSAENKYRVAVVGGVGIWGRHYLRACVQHPRSELIALVDTARQRRQPFADHYGIRRVYDTVDDLFADEVPDIVCASVPVGSNHAVVTACAQAGVKAVSCEKPLAPTLGDADEMVRLCRQRGTAFGCGTAHWEIPRLPRIAAWIQEGNLGRLTSAAIPGGLPREVSGSGCVQLTHLRLLTGAEVEWVEGRILPREEGWLAPDDATDVEIDSPAYGRLGLSGGIVCEVLPPQPEVHIPCRISVTGEDGQAWTGSPHSVLVKGRGPASSPVYPDFLDTPWTDDVFTHALERLMRAVDTGEEARCSGHDYRQALEIAIAIKQSAARDSQRVTLPLADRSLRLFPHLYRLQGGDVVAWERVGYDGPPAAPRAISSFDELADFSDRQIQHLMRQVDQQDLVKALCNAGPAVTEKILGNLSERVRTFIREEVESQGQIPAEEVERARETILLLARTT